MKKYICLIVTTIITSATIANAKTCIKSEAELEKTKANFPAILQSFPVYLTTEGMFVNGALQLRATGEKLKLDSAIIAPGEKLSDEFYIQQICVETEGSLEIRLENGKSHSVQVTPSTAKIRGVKFSKSSAADYTKLKEKLEKDINNSKPEDSTTSERKSSGGSR